MYSFHTKKETSLHFNRLITAWGGVIPVVLFNNEELIPPYTSIINDYYVSSATTLYPNIISVNGEKKEIILKNLNPFETLKLKINGHEITLHLRDFSFPNFTFSKKHEKADNRYILLTPFHANNTFPSYA